MSRLRMPMLSFFIFVFAWIRIINSQACQFYPLGETRRFEKIAENIPVDHEVFRVQVFPRVEFRLEAMDNSLSDIQYFKYGNVDDQTVSVKVAKSLEDLVDRHDPQSVLKFKLTCRGGSGTEEAFLPVTIYIDDVNDHAPQFQNTPYHLEVDELTPVGLTVFRGIHATDKDKPNTANSDVTYSIVGGNENNSFALSDPIEGILVVNKPLDYDNGLREYQLKIKASDHGSPHTLATLTTLTIKVKDSDDQNPRFTQDIYKTSVLESAKITGARIRSKLILEPPIHAFDQDTGINAALRYDIIHGNDRGFFEMHEQTGELYLVKEIDLETLPNRILSLRVQATQMDNALRQAIAKVDVEVLDVNDNSPVFEFDTYNITVMENLPIGFTVVQVYAHDDDSGENKQFNYQLAEQSDAFTIDPSTGGIVVKDSSKLDREAQDLIRLNVVAIEKKPNVNPDAKKSATTVEIHLLDANDNNPQFIPGSIYTFHATELEQPGTVIGNIKAVDPDLGFNGMVEYFIQQDGVGKTAPFYIDRINGTVIVAESFSSISKKPSKYTFFALASDKAQIESERRTSTAIVNVEIIDVNNNPPEFIGAPYEAFIGESLPPGAFVFQLQARDTDFNTVLSYGLVGGNEEGKFRVDPNTGRITTAAVLDFEQKQTYDLVVQALDGINSVIAGLTVHVVDINDQQPRFIHNIYNFSVFEEIQANLTVGSVLAIDADSGKNALVQYKILGEQGNNAFVIDLVGNILTRRSLDREVESSLEFLVVAFDAGTPQLSGTTTVTIQVEDINDNPPHFESDTYIVNVPEEEEPPYNVFQVKASDKDEGANAVIKYNILGGNEEKLFDINEDTGVVFSTEKLNFERQADYVLHIAARNILPFQGPQAAKLANPFVKLVIQVQDVNDELVVFTKQSYEFQIKENTTRSVTVGYVNATNPQRPSTEQDISYWIGNGNSDGKFWINPSSGELILMDRVDRDPPESQQLFKLRIFARDLLSRNQLNTTVPVTIYVEDVNDNSPTFDEEKYVLELPENLPVGTQLPGFYKAKDIDSGDNGKVGNYTIIGSEDIFKIDPVTGTLELIAILDYERRDKHSFMVFATDSGIPPLTGSASVTIKVQNINEFAPEFIGLPYDFWVEENAIKGTRIGQIKAIDGDGNNVKYSLTGGDSGFFSIDQSVGHVYVQKDLDSRTSYTFIARATDDGVPQNNSIGVQVTVYVRERNDYPPVFSQLTYYGKVKEKEQSPHPVAKVQANDQDLQNNSLTYIIKSGNEENIFNIDAMNGEIRVIPSEAHRLDFDRKKNYVLLVEARDSHVSPLYGLAVVMIEVVDINDHPPVFSQSSYSASLAENLPAGHCFLKVQANGGDTVDIISYSLDRNNVPFTINPKTGDICLKHLLDREVRDNYDFIARAFDGQFESKVPVSVQVEDENDNPPQFERERYVVSIPPLSTAGRTVVQVHANDPDLASNGEVTYWIKNTHGLFEVDSETGVVRLMNSLPNVIQRNKTYEMEVFARDHGAASNIGKTLVIVRVATTKNNPPKFEKLGYSVSVDENRANVPLLNVHAFDPDDGKAGKLKYRIVRATLPNAFKIEEDTGKITLVSPLDYETMKHIELTVEASDESNEPLFATTVVQVTVNDMNDNSPMFLAMPRVLRIPVSTLPKQVVYTVHATDVDSGINGNNNIKYEMIPPSPLFAIHSTTGQIYVTQSLLPITEKLNIIATDSATYPLSNTAELMIEVFKDSVDEPLPKFTSAQYSVDVDGLLEVGSTVLNVRAVIPNGNPIWYNISRPDGSPIRQFTIDHKTGKVTTASKLSNEHTPLYDFLISAHNRNDLNQYVETSAVVRIKPDSTRCPKFPFSEYFTSIKETAPPDMVVLPTLLVEDMGIYDKLSYQITEDNSNDNFFVDVRSNNVSLRVKKPLDRDTMNPSLHGMYTLTVTASNQRCSGSTHIKILIKDVNDNSPVFEKKEFVIDLKENAQAGHVVAHLTATDRDESDKKLRYFIVDGNGRQDFRIEGSTGVLSVKIPPDRETTPRFMLRVLAIDSANNTGFADVHINILDENDWIPTFSNETYLLNVTEGSASIGTKLYLPVTDNDEGTNSEMDIFIEEGNSRKNFKLDRYDKGAVLTVVKELDREKFGVSAAALHKVVVTAKDRGVPSLTGSAMIAVIIHDINDSPPVFDKEVYYKFVSENIPVGAIITTMVATDADSDNNNELTYSFSQDTSNVPFSIDPKSGAVNVTRHLDISENREYSLTVEAYDGVWTNKTTLNIFVQEAEERDPRFHQMQYRFAVPENIIGAFVGQVELQARQQRLYSQTKYSIVNADMRPLFNITKDGNIFTRVALDREKRSKYTFTVMLQEKRPSTKVSVCEVSVEVLDINDEVPTFQHSYQGTIKENSPPGTAVIIDPVINAVDKDSENNSVVFYSLRGEGSDLFTILDNGIVVFSSPDQQNSLDRERQDTYRLQVTATDMGNLSSFTDLTITVEDENDNVPVFEHPPLHILLPETARPGSKIGEVRAFDGDGKGPNSKVEYFITSGDKGDVRVDRQSGEIYLVGKLKPSTVLLLNITAVDGHGLATFTFVNITVLDVNDHHPTFLKTEYLFSVKEGNYTNNRVQLGVLHAVDQDTGKNGLVDYTIMKTFDKEIPFAVDVHTGELFAKGVIDREKEPTYHFIVMALDYGEPPLNATVKVTVDVEDVNDERPRFFTDPYLAQVFENLDPGQKVTQISAYDSDSNLNGQVFYKLGEGHDNKFYIDSKDGTIWTLAKLDYEKKPFYNMTVIAYDQGSPSLASTAKLWVTVIDTNDAVPEFTKSVYTLEVAENRQPGDVVFTLDAGEGEFKYTLNNKEEADSFEIDSKTGDIRLLKALDSVQRSFYRLLVTASVDTIPPKSDNTEVNIIVGTGQGVRMFPSRLYEVTVFENQLAPMIILDLNSTDEISHHPVRYTIAGQDYNGLFVMERESGRLSVTESLDREHKNRYTLKVRAEKGRRVGRDIKEKTDEASYHLAYDEALVVIEVGDENDNPPMFDTQGKPVVAAVPLEASFGYQVAKLKANDADIGYNKAIRYEIIRKPEDASTKFHIDPVTGVIRSMITFALDGGRIYGFDVKATDREGSEHGHSAVVNVFVYVLPETKLVMFVAATTPLVIEENVDKMLSYLSNVTDMDVKMAKLEPHHEGEREHPDMTDIFLYAIDHQTNDVVETESLLSALKKNSNAIITYLDQFNIRHIQGVSVQEKISQMGTTEIAIIALSSVIFLGAVLGIGLLCSSCKKSNKPRYGQKQWEHQKLYSIKNPLMSKSIGNPYGQHTPSGTIANMKAMYPNGMGDYADSLNDDSSMKRNSRRSRQHVPPDGASSLNPSRSPRFERYKKGENQWYDMKDGLDSVISGVSKGSAFNSWSSMPSRNNNPVTEL